jgi:hypothetical protein
LKSNGLEDLLVYLDNHIGIQQRLSRHKGARKGIPELKPAVWNSATRKQLALQVSIELYYVGTPQAEICPGLKRHDCCYPTGQDRQVLEYETVPLEDPNGSPGA